MFSILTTNLLEKDVKLARKRGKDLQKLSVIISLISNQSQLPASYRLHKLSGSYNGFWEVHIEPDWLLIFLITLAVLFSRTGSHADLLS